MGGVEGGREKERREGELFASEGEGKEKSEGQRDGEKGEGKGKGEWNEVK